MMKVLEWAVVLLMAVLGLTAGAPALASAAPDTRADVTHLQLLDQDGSTRTRCAGVLDLLRAVCRYYYTP
jgi:hypothetical protein